MYPINLKLDMCPEELRYGLAEIAAEWPRRFTASEKTHTHQFEHCATSCSSCEGIMALADSLPAFHAGTSPFNKRVAWTRRKPVPHFWNSLNF